MKGMVVMTGPAGWRRVDLRWGAGRVLQGVGGRAFQLGVFLSEGGEAAGIDCECAASYLSGLEDGLNATAPDDVLRVRMEVERALRTLGTPQSECARRMASYGLVS
jgi:hypothetical protein